MMFKALLSFAVCGVAAVDTDTTSRLHHHKHVEAHAHKASAAGIIGAAAVGAAGVGALGTMGSITSNNGVSTSDTSNPSDNICVLGFEGLGLTCSLASASNSAALCAAGGTAGAGACSWVQDNGGGATTAAPFIVYDDNNRFGLNQCFPNPTNFATNGGDCSWWANSEVMCKAAENAGFRQCIYDDQALACNNCRAVNSACKNFKSKESCQENAVRTAAGQTLCTWGRDKVGGYEFSCK